MAGLDNKIISELKRQNSIGNFETFFLGPEQRYVGPLRNGSINNLEEQYLLGTDTYTETYLDENENTIIEKSFHTNNVNHIDAINYYKIISCIYKNKSVIEEANYHFDEESIYFPYSPNDVLFGDGTISYPNVETLYMINNSIFQIDEDKINIYPPYAYLLRKDKLYYITENITTLILTKETVQKEINDNGFSKTIVIETITNHLL